MRLVALFAAGAVLAPIAMIAPVAAAPSEAAAGEAKQKERLICRRSMITGTRVGTHRICMTQRQWEENEDEQRTNMKGFQDRQVCFKYGLNGRSDC